MKPKIYRHTNIFGKTYWCCGCKKYCGMGSSPADSYKDWLFAKDKHENK